MPNLNTQQNQILAVVNFKSAKKENRGTNNKSKPRSFLKLFKNLYHNLKKLSIYILTIHKLYINHCKLLTFACTANPCRFISRYFGNNKISVNSYCTNKRFKNGAIHKFFEFRIFCDFDIKFHKLSGISRFKFT